MTGDDSASRRLRDLLAERRAAGPGRPAVDARIWEELGAELCVMTTDLAGFSRGVAEHGILHFLQVIEDSVRVLEPVIRRHGGRLLKVEGDSLMATFADPRDGVRAAVAMQEAAAAHNAVHRLPAAEQLRVGIGLGWGRVLRIGEVDVFGVEVNAACLLGEDTAGAGEILVTAAVQAAVGALPGVGFEPVDCAPPGTSGAWRVRAAATGG